MTSGNSSRLLRRSSSVGLAVKLETSAKSKRPKREFGFLLLMLLFSLLVVNFLVLAIIEGVVNKENPMLNSVKYFDEVNNPYEEIIKDTIPFVQLWFRSIVGTSNEKPKIELAENELVTKESACISLFYDKLMIAVPNSSPQMVQAVLESMGLVNVPAIRSHFKSWLEAPQPLDVLYNDSFDCFDQSYGAIKKMSCQVAESIDHWDVNNPHHTSFASHVVHLGLVEEILTEALQEDIATLSYVADIMSTTQSQKIRREINGRYKDSALREFFHAKYDGVAYTLRMVTHALSGNRQILNGAFYTLQTNILEAVKLDAVLGNHGNALSGLALAAAVNFDPLVAENDVKWRLGAEWVESYIAWNMIFVMAVGDLTYLPKLSIPSISCSVHTSKEGEGFLLARTISLSLSLMHVSTVRLQFFLLENERR